MSTDLTPVPGAEPRFDDEGHEIVDIATCGVCGRSWNDAAVSSVTPAPSGRCPFEYEHGHDANTTGSLYHVLRAEIAEALQNRNRDDLIERMATLSDDEIAEAECLMVDHVERALDPSTDCDES